MDGVLLVPQLAAASAERFSLLGRRESDCVLDGIGGACCLRGYEQKALHLLSGSDMMKKLLAVFA